MFIKKIHSRSLHHENCYPTGMTTYRVLLGPKTRFLLYFDNLTKSSFLCYHCFFFLDSVQNSIFLVVRHDSIRGYVRPSVGRLVGLSVRPSVRPLVGPPVRRSVRRSVLHKRVEIANLAYFMPSNGTRRYVT